MREAERERSFKAKLIAYTVLRLIVVGFIVWAIINKNWSDVVICVLMLLEFMLPSIIEKSLKVEFPSGFEITIIIFMFMGQILAQVANFMQDIAVWDSILHTMTGFLMAALGFGLIDILNQSPKISFSLSPFFAAFVAFCFSMTIAVLWEFGEYSLDNLIGSDMQKDRVTDTVISEIFNPEGGKPAMVVEDITETHVYGTVNGEQTVVVLNGYVDIGLYDTMKDMFVNFVGALVFCVFGGLYIKNRGKGKLAKAFIPQTLTNEEAEQMQSQRRRYYKKVRNKFRRLKVDDLAGDGSADTDEGNSEDL